MNTLKSLIVLLLFGLAVLPSSKASHMVGSDVSYTCTTTPGVYLVTMRMYRDCQGIQICGGGVGPTGCVIPGCSKSVSVSGAASPCTGTGFGSVTVTALPNVSGYDVVQLCAQQVTVCSNCQTRTPGTFTPGIEVFTFQGTVNLNSLGIPSTCCKIALGYSECCRNAALTTLVPGNFYTEAIIDRCVTPCNSAPVYTNDPVAVTCAGQDYLFNLGAIDPDGDSLSYTLGQSLQGSGSPVTYVSPYSAGVPFPFLGVPNANAPAPAGIHVDPVTGDLSFRPQGYFVSNLVIEVKQWKLVNGVYVHVGTTRRDVQFYSVACLSNFAPRLNVYRNGVLQSKPYQFDVCAGQQICLDIAGWDSQFDTTDINWNNPVVANPLFAGATFVPLYVPSQRRITGPRLDSFRFCWTPQPVAARLTPHSFTVTAKDRFCPLPGRITQGINIRVMKVPNPLITRVNKNCGFYDFSYQQLDNPPLPLNNSYTQWEFESSPGTGSFTPKAQQSVTNQFFSQGGWYKYKLRLTTTYPAPTGCPYTKVDSFYNPFPVDVRGTDSFNCIGNPITVTAHSWWGTPFGNSFKFYQGGSAAGSGYASQSLINRSGQFPTDSLLTTNPTNTGNRTYYKVVITDLSGCKDSDEFFILTRALPLKELTPKIRICPGTDTSFYVGDNGGQPLLKSFWYTAPNTTIKDSMPTYYKPNVSFGDSGTYVLKKIDTYGCIRWDTSRLYVNQPVTFETPHDTACFGDPLFTLKANPLTAFIDSFIWTSVPGSNVLSTADTLQSPTSSTQYSYGLRGWVVYDGVACYKDDTATLYMNPLPQVTGKPSAISICRDAVLSNLPSSSVITNPGGTAVTKSWSYPKAPGAVRFGTQLLVDSLKWLPPSTASTPYGNYIYVTVTDGHGCKIKDSVLYAIFPITPVTMTAQRMCDFAPQFMLYTYPGAIGGTNEFWYGNGVSFNNTTKRFYFNPADTPNIQSGINVGGNVRAGLTLANDSNILTYEFRRTFPATSPVTFSPSIIGITAASPFGGCPSSDTVIFRVIKSPKLKAGSLPPICIGSDSFDISSHAVPGTNYTTAANPATSTWYFAAPNQSLKAISGGKRFLPKSSDLVVPNDGRVTYRLVYQDIATTCRVADTTDMIVNGLPSVDINTFPDYDSAVCQRSTPVNFQRTPSAWDASFVLDSAAMWGTPDPAVLDLAAGTFNSSHSSITESTYWIKFYYRNADRCANMDSTPVRVQIPPQLSLGTDGQVCSYDAQFAVNMTTIPKTPYSVNWGHDGFGSIANTTPTGINYDATAGDITRGTIKFWAISGNNRLCAPASDTVFYTIFPKPYAEFQCLTCQGCVREAVSGRPDRTPIPLNSSFQADPTTVAGSNYIWYINGAPINGATGSNLDSVMLQSFSNPGNYKVQLIVASPNNCFDTSIVHDVDAWATPIADFTTDPITRQTSVAKPYFSFNNASTIAGGSMSDMTFLWDLREDPFPPYNPRTSTEVSPQRVQFTADTGSQTIRLVATSNRGCIDSISYDVLINPDITVFVPNVFYPGSQVTGCPDMADPNEKCNAKFYVSAHNFETIEIFVFNRWGKLVFQTNDPKVGWDGTDMKSGGICEQDAYIYQVNATSYAGKKYQYSGSITLLR